MIYTTVELECDRCKTSYAAGPHENWAEWAVRKAAAGNGWQVANTRRTGKRVSKDLCPKCRTADTSSERPS